MIKQFQGKVWNGETFNKEIVSGLANDLDFYEPNVTLRAPDSSYYGDERLELEIELALQKLKSSS